ncbi:hypothetical protein [Sphingobacterium griseoflavum]|nr:hypothetical protein [Sphingobacterium griseoflavum]
MGEEKSDYENIYHFDVESLLKYYKVLFTNSNSNSNDSYSIILLG